MRENAKKLFAYLFTEAQAVLKESARKALRMDFAEFEEALKELKDFLQGSGLVLVDFDNALALKTDKETSEFLAQVYGRKRKESLGNASLEVLAILFYNGPSSKAEIDYIRGVNSTSAIKTLLIRGLATKREDGKYAPTPDAIAFLGIESQEELPEYQTIKQAIETIKKE